MSERSKRLPELIEPLQLARMGRVLAGRLPVARMRRLASALSDDEGEVEATLEFGHDEVGNPCIAGTLRAELGLVCQRCLEPMRRRIEASLLLGIVTSEAAVERLDRGYEPLLLNEDRLALSALIEDELILALPQVAMHPAGECAIAEAYRVSPEAVAGEPARKNPFAVLSTLKKHD